MVCFPHRVSRWVVWWSVVLVEYRGGWSGGLSSSSSIEVGGLVVCFPHRVSRWVVCCSDSVPRWAVRVPSNRPDPRRTIDCLKVQCNNKATSSRGV